MDSSKHSTRTVSPDLAHLLPSTQGDVPLGGLAKRLFDIVFSLVALASFLVPMIVIVLVVRSQTGGPAFFVHWRVGHGGTRIPCLKFRTMYPDAEQRLEELLAADSDAREEFLATRKLRSDPRIIPGIGTFLRKSSLDELPQFINVLLGHMSVVGPRPVTAEEVPMYGPVAPKYLRTRPGITGLWQVSGRSNTSFQERVDFDLSYVDNWSFWTDLQIILRTIFVLSKDSC
ncbi:sugar transferase [Aestuariicoccus sp. MJ-SS9]|uniref:sugar transferase n=1 Tax=Aestuariicoccus sp. MJ-SS9 TaxID=3079855 RepID=UPI00290FCE5F|nr:sugar transferase [Aestuariicoccus sp. MJ-SS9]MDU8913848.1 sugar transferase [Aestuariicoccus sp. MJ-SS9]